MGGIMFSAYRVCLVCLVLLASAVFAGQAADEFVPKFKTEVKEEGELKLDWVWQPYLSGSLLFVSVHRSGTVNIFSRDTATGDIKFLKAVTVSADLGNPTRHLDPHVALSPKNILYVAGGWTHAGSDNDSIGLSWYQIDPKDGSAKKLGTIKCAAGVLHASVNPNVLYLSTYFAKEIHHIALDPNDGKPVIGEKVAGKGLGRELACSPDRKTWYSMTKDAIGCMTADKDGKLTYGASVEIPGVPENANSQCLFASPDGRHVYVALRYDYGKPGGAKGYVGVFKRDDKTGALTFSERLELNALGGAAQVAFLSDGKLAYFCGCPESPAAGLGYLKRDPETGKLTLGGKTPGANPASFLAYARDTGTIYLGGFWSTKSFKVFSALKDSK
jgi:6-phosphogluconolactonase (cycloisomerase 2 family)